MRKYIIALAITALSSFVGRSAWSDVQYAVTDLGTLGGSQSCAFGINNHGQVVGWAMTTGNATTHAFLSDSGVMTDLDPLGDSSVAYAINDSGQVVGQAASHATLFNNGMTTNLFPGSISVSTAYGINASGTVVGSAYGWTGTYSMHAFVYRDGGKFDPTPSLIYSEAYGINAHGDVVGEGMGIASGAFLYANETLTTISSMKAGTAINAEGLIAGCYSANDPAFVGSPDHACIYSDGMMTDIQPNGVNGRAYSVNGAGEVVATGSPGVGSRGYLYKNGTWSDLNYLIDESSGWTIVGARGINDSGWIAGTGDFNGVQHAILLTPTPEPASLILLGIGAISLFGGAGRRRRTA